MAGKELNRPLLLICCGLLFMVLQTTWLPRHTLFGARPDLMLICICCLGLSRGISTSIPAGIICGTMYGALNGQFLMTLVLWTIVSAAAGLSNNNIFISSRPLAGMITAAGTLLSFFVYGIFAALFLKEPFYTAWETPLITMIVNGALAYLIYPLFALPDTRVNPYE